MKTYAEKVENGYKKFEVVVNVFEMDVVALKIGIFVSLDSFSSKKCR